MILALGGTRVLVDPWFHSGVVTRQREPLGLTPDGLPPLADEATSGVPEVAPNQPASPGSTNAI